jgi:hypothetical protein
MTKVRWRYSSESWQEVEGDNYLCEEVQVPCPNKPHELIYGRQNIVNATTSCTLTNITTFAPVRNWVGNASAPYTNLKFTVPGANFQRIFPDPINASGFNIHWCVANNYPFTVHVTDKDGIERLVLSASTRGLVFFKFQPVPGSVCPPPNQKFTITKNGQTVYTETRLTCPEVKIISDECPPNTCDVLCGDTICCYGADGISVFNYPNT